MVYKHPVPSLSEAAGYDKVGSLLLQCTSAPLQILKT